MSELSETAVPSLARGVRVQMDAATGEPVLVYPEGVLFLNETAHAVVQRCDGRATIAVIAASLAEDFDADPDTLLADVLECVTDLKQRRLILLQP